MFGKILGTEPAMDTVEIWEIPLGAPETARSDSHAALRAIAAMHPGASTSLSHTDGLALIAVADRSVGVDVECLGNAPSTAVELEDLLALTLSERERHDVLAAGESAAAARWLTIWTRKEAVLKAAGPSLSDPAIRDIDAFAPGVCELELPPGFVGAVAVAMQDRQHA